jgi:hypothetical protein
LSKKKPSEKKQKNKKRQLVIMTIITVGVITSYLYLQFNPDFDPTVTEDLPFSEPSVKSITVEKHLKNGIEDFTLKIGDMMSGTDKVKKVEQFEDDNPEVLGLIVETDLEDGTIDYKLHISNEMGSLDEAELLARDLAEFKIKIKDISCDELDFIINLDNLKDESFGIATQLEIDSRC